ncbi:helix-turn-helix domain-containing protein [Hyphomonas sp.]|uniref:helix-turn-helix domain-containing protein n=1 Tax=Hyphomonas sp. TaxID=87 RepID=UPI0039197D63
MTAQKFDPRKDEDVAGLAAALVAFALGLSAEAVAGPGRGRPVEARARHVAMYLAYTGCDMSLARVARAFQRDRSTVAHACQLVEEYREDPDFDIWVEQLAVGLRSVAVLAARELPA